MKLGEVVAPLLVRLPSKAGQGIGSCFLIGGADGKVIALTAKHCIDFAVSEDVPRYATSAPGSPFAIDRTAERWNRIAVDTLVEHQDVPPFMRLPLTANRAFCCPDTDIALLVMQPQDEYSFIKITQSLPIWTGPVEVGEEVVVIGYFNTDVRSSFPRDVDGHPAFEAVAGNLSCLKTRVTGVYREVRDMRWPSIKLDCPLFSGMSGGCVLVERENTPCAVAVISRDISYSAGSTGEEAYAALLEPALDVGVIIGNAPDGGLEGTQTLRDLVGSGMIIDLAGKTT